MKLVTRRPNGTLDNDRPAGWQTAEQWKEAVDRFDIMLVRTKEIGASLRQVLVDLEALKEGELHVGLLRLPASGCEFLERSRRDPKDLVISDLSEGYAHGAVELRGIDGRWRGVGYSLYRNLFRLRIGDYGADQICH